MSDTQVKKTLKEKVASGANGFLSWLSGFNDALEALSGNLNKWFVAFANSSEEMVQSQVDIWCRRQAWHINVFVEERRQAVIKSLYKQNKGMTIMLQAVSIVQNAISDPIGAIGGVLSFLFKPATAIISFTVTLITEIARLAANLATLASFVPPAPLNPNINYDAFQLQIGSISMGDIIAGPDALKPPREMFPEPTKSFSKEAFNESFDKAESAAADEKVVYHLPRFDTSKNKVSGGEGLA